MRRRRDVPQENALSPSPARLRSTLATVLDQPDELRALKVMHKTLADVNRLRIIQRLSRGHASVTELIAEVGLSQPLVSWHVRSLRAAGLVEARRNGRETLVRLRPEAWEAFVERERAILGLAAGSAAAPGGAG